MPSPLPPFLHSLSEYGCNTNTRKFGEVASLYSTAMTGVFSGGLVYEYSDEGTKYGLVQLNGDSVSELDDYKSLKDAYSKQQNPSGDGGYKSSGKASQCPSKSVNWDVADDTLPANHDKPKNFLKKGAGPGPGLGGSGSQEAGTPSSGDATAGSGAVTSTAASPSGTKKAAATNVRAPEKFTAPLVGALALMASTLLGSSLLL